MNIRTAIFREDSHPSGGNVHFEEGGTMGSWLFIQAKGLG